LAVLVAFLLFSVRAVDNDAIKAEENNQEIDSGCDYSQ